MGITFTVEGDGYQQNRLYVAQYNLHMADVWHTFNTLRTGDAHLRFYITTVQDG